jgi:Family of unknown function (DUF6551)
VSNTALETAVHVRKARRRSVCALCRGPVLVGQQIGSDGGGWSHVRCFIADRKERMTASTEEYSYGEVGHDPPVHVVTGLWQGPKQTTRDSAMNVSLCGRRLARRIKERPTRHALCRECEELMDQAALSPNAPNELPLETCAQAPAELESLRQDYEVLVIQLGQMFVDRSVPGLQRPLQVPRARRMAARFSWARFYENPPKVSARPDGRYHIMDGQHEVEAARIAGSSPDTPVRVHVWRNLNYQQESEMFGHNRDRGAVRALDLFASDVTSGHADAVALDVLLNTYKWTAGSAGVEGNIAAVTTIRRIYGKKNGPELCEKVIATITKAWGHNSDGAHQAILKVLGAFYEEYPAADIGRLAHVLDREVKPQDVPAWTHEKGWQSLSVARLQGLYDNGLRDPARRLKPSRG